MPTLSQDHAMQQARRTRELGERIERARTSAESPHGEVRVTVDATGGLIGLHLRPGARELPLDRLAALVVAASKDARTRMARHVCELTGELSGAEPDTVELVPVTP